jgi:pre-mRNA-splicing helicase BRR2
VVYRVMLQAPRRSPALPSPDGKLAVFTQSTYSFDTHTKQNVIGILDIEHGQTMVISKDNKASEPRWLGNGHELVWLREGDTGNTSFIICDASQPGKTYNAGTLPGAVSNLKVHLLESGAVAFAVSAQANPDGTLHNHKDDQKSHSTARIYDSVFVRHWDRYVTEQRTSIFTGLLKKSVPKVTSRAGRYNLISFHNALAGTGLESPIPPFGGTDHFDIGSCGLVFVAKDPELDPATHTKCNVYLILRDHENIAELCSPAPRMLEVPGYDGAASSPVFSPDGQSVAFLKMKTDGYESDKNWIVLYHFTLGLNILMTSGELKSESSWDRSPSAVMYSNDGASLLVQAEDTGAGCLFSYDLTKSPRPMRPSKITTSGYILDVAPLATDSRLLLVSSNSLVDNSTYTIVDPAATEATCVVSSITEGGAMFGLSPTQVSSIWWKGANDHPVHALMMRPSFYKTGKKYPLAYLIHGGPQGAWNDQWSTRWNPAVFAEQGYVVICPNPTGSTGYGQGFTDAIRNQWGGLPYEDLVKGFEYIEADLDFVDTSRAVALGASYGGYMMNWIQGHDLAKKFQALVCHDGVFSMAAQLASDEQYFPLHELGGPIWKRQSMYDKWDPSRFTGNWDTPMLVIHNELDYRLTIAEGLAAFNVLQMRGVESRFLSFPDENHWVLKPENSRVWHHQVINWINKFVGLPTLLDKDGKDGSEYCRQPRRPGRAIVPALGLD